MADNSAELLATTGALPGHRTFAEVIADAAPRRTVRRLHLVLGDQLDVDAPAIASLDPASDAVLMMEVLAESRHVPSHVQRTTLFLSAMRHFALQLHRGRGIAIRYITLDDPANRQGFAEEIDRAITDLQPASISVVHPGEWRVLEMFERSSHEIEILPDKHFYGDIDEFRDWAEGRKELVMEHFYREQRRKHRILLDENGRPVGGKWNFDSENRGAFKGPPRTPPPLRFQPDEITREVTETVHRMLPEMPGSLITFQWPVAREQARAGLRDFIERRLPLFGRYQDAMWAGEDFLYHGLLSSSLNLKLLNPRECVQAALDALATGHAPLNAVEGFIRQVIGWREFIRGIYWLEGPDYGQRNQLNENGRLPDFYWWGDDAGGMACLTDCLRSVKQHGYGHHIARLMVMGNFALIAGVHPRQVSDWYLAMYVDAVDWVTLPNTLGMVMHADGGVVGTKPYAASGKYIRRQSNYCEHCRYDVSARTGERACPFNTFYWDFLIRHRERFRHNRRMAMILKNVDRLAPHECEEIRADARQRREQLGILTIEGEQPEDA